MSKDRNCNMNYPVYPMMTPSMPMGYAQNPMMGQMPTGCGCMQNSTEQQIQNLYNQVNNLEKRVTILENKTNNNYNDSNYYMV